MINNQVLITHNILHKGQCTVSTVTIVSSSSSDDVCAVVTQETLALIVVVFSAGLVLCGLVLLM